MMLRVARLDALSGEMPRLDDFDTLYVDGNWLETSMPDKSNAISGIKLALLSGKPVAAFGGNFYLSDLVNSTLIKEKMELPILAHAMKVYPQHKS